MGDVYERFSTVTGKKYNVFETCKILNLQQVMYYMQTGVYPVDIKITQNNNGDKCLVFYFNRTESKKAYEDWCSTRKKE